MSKKVFFLAALLTTLSVATFADDYPINYDKTTAVTHADRRLNSVSVAGTSVNVPDNTLLYNNVTDEKFTVRAGQAVTASVGFTGQWMNAYVYIDYDGNKQFDVQEPNSDGTLQEDNELVSYSYYVIGGVRKNSAGETLANGNNINLPTFVIPADLTPGTYKMRFKVDWSSIDPGGATVSGNDIVTNGGAILDIDVEVLDKDAAGTTVNWASTVTDNNVSGGVYWIGAETPGIATKYTMSSFSLKLASGYMSSTSYLAIATANTTGRGSLSESEVVAVSSNAVTPSSATGAMETYTFSTPVELSGNTTYYLYFVSSNTPVSGSYSSVGQRVRVLTNTTYTPEVNAGGTVYSTYAPVFQATLAYDSSDLSSFFSSTYGEKWVRITSAENSGYSWEAMPYIEDTYAPRTNANDASNEAQLWCIVGTKDNCMIYNRLLGEGYALTTNEVPASSGTYVSIVAAENARPWKVVDTYAESIGYIFRDSEETNNVGVNMYGGAGRRDLRFYTSGVSNTGSFWSVADASVEISFTIAGLDSIASYCPYVGNIACNEGAIRVTDDNFNKDAWTKKLYVSEGGNLTMSSSAVGTGFEFKGFSVNGGEQTKSVKVNKSGSVEIVATYENTNPGVRYIYFNGSDRDAIGVPYRIPAIASAPNGDILAFNDRRYSGADIGSGHLDVVGRISNDFGDTWGEDINWFDGTSSWGYGDPAAVCDRDSNICLLVSCSGNTMFTNGTLNRHQGMAHCILVLDGTGNWVRSEEIGDMAEYIYMSVFASNVKSMFIGSGRIAQSRIIKKDKFYRLYCAVLAINQSNNAWGNYVIYSDDFGKTWAVLGGYDSFAATGNEPKCEELPDGSVLISSRNSNGRNFNIFYYTNQKNATGNWSSEIRTNSYSNEGGIAYGNNSCNGEILMVKAVKASNNDTITLALQSIPTGNSREKTAIFYKELKSRASHWATPAMFAKNWTKYEVCDHSAAYSTMIEQKNGVIGFYQEESLWGGNYDMVYIPLTIETITNGAYKTIEKGDDITGISSTTSVVPNGNRVVYDLLGRRVTNPDKGIYIINGKKVML
ncbi:MAG: exo-alpha-sialidase [Bacteroidaceae bacterium]|nr:exo-alpha-sialidase [Bacteroidaceae bacterium]